MVFPDLADLLEALRVDNKHEQEYNGGLPGRKEKDLS